MKRTTFKLKTLLILLLLFFLTTSCGEDKKEVTLKDLSSFGQNFNKGCGNFVVYAYSPDKRYVLQIRSDEREFLTENGVTIDLKDHKTVKATLMDHRDLTKRALEREIYCTDIIIMEEGKVVKWDINQGTVTFNKTEKAIEGENDYDTTYKVTTKVKNLKLKVDGKEFIIDDIMIKDIRVGWYSG